MLGTWFLHEECRCRVIHLLTIGLLDVIIRVRIWRNIKGVGVPRGVFIGILVVVLGATTKTHAADERRLALFEADLNLLRQRYNIPGLSAAIVKNQRIIWEGAYGYA